MRIALLLTLTAFLLLLCAAQSSAQSTEKFFSGFVFDSIEKTPVEGCTVTVQNNKGTLSKTATDGKGFFSFKQSSDTVHLLLQRIGYAEKKVWLLSKNAVDTFFLLPLDKAMDSVIVKAKVPPIVVRGDTTEYNIDSSMFEPFDVVEDLVKRLPGLEIDAEGKMTFHGKHITRILVDGEDLFAGDPEFSMKKLPAGLVAKIQVMDTKTLEQIFSGEAPNGDDKTLNIKLKAGNKTFGNAAAMAGTRNTLDGNGTLSQFNGARRYSISGTYNSNNKTGLFKTPGGPTSSASSGGLNYSDKWGPLRIGGSYGYSQSGAANNLYRERTQIITTDTALFTKISNRYNNNSESHRANLNVNWWMDSSSILDATLGFAASKNQSNNTASSLTNENGSLRNQSLNRSSTAGTTQTVSATLSWRKWFNRKGRYLTLNARTNLSDQGSDVASQSDNTYFKAGLPVSGDTLNRQTKTAGEGRAYSVSFTYSEPVSKSFRFSLNGGFDVNRSASNRAVYNLDSFTHSATFDSLYSAQIVSSASTQNLTASLVYNTGKLNVSSGLATVWQQTERTVQRQVLRQNLLRHSPSVNATYLIGKQQSLRMAFSAVTAQPTVDQLQPVPDNSNPLYVRIGNPALRTAFLQNYTIGYNYFNKGTTLTTNASYSPVSNEIVNAVTYDAYRRAVSQYINVSGVYTARADLNLSRLYHSKKATTDWSLAAGATQGRRVYFQSNKQYASRNDNLRTALSFARRGQAVRAPGFGLSFSASYDRNRTPADPAVLNTARLSLSPEAEGGYAFGAIYASAAYRLWYNKIDYHAAQRRNDEYSIHEWSNGLRWQVLKKWSVQTALTYRYNTQAPEGVGKGQLNTNLSAQAQLWKGRGQVSLTAVDLFVPAQSFRRVAGENFIEDIQTENLRNYFTLRLQWGFSKLEKKEAKR